MQLATNKTLIFTVGCSGSGKSTALNKLFPDCVVSTDHCRFLISGDEGNQACSRQAFDLFYKLIEERMANGLLVAADSTALQPKYRKRFKELARKYGYQILVLVFDVDSETCIKRQDLRTRKVPTDVIENQHAKFRQSKSELSSEKYDGIFYYKDGFHIWDNRPKANI